MGKKDDGFWMLDWLAGSSFLSFEFLGPFIATVCMESGHLLSEEARNRTRGSEKLRSAQAFPPWTMIMAGTIRKPRSPAKGREGSSPFQLVPKTTVYSSSSKISRVETLVGGSDRTVSSDGKQIIRPYPNLKLSNLPNKSLRNKLLVQWNQFFKCVEPFFRTPFSRYNSSMIECLIRVHY